MLGGEEYGEDDGAVLSLHWPLMVRSRILGCSMWKRLVSIQNPASTEVELELISGSVMCRRVMLRYLELDMAL